MRFLLASLSFSLLLLSGCANLAEPPAKVVEKEKEIEKYKEIYINLHLKFIWK